MKIKRSPNSLAHHGETDEDDGGRDGPDNFKSIVAMRIGSALGAGVVAELEDDPSQANLRGGEGHADDDDGDHELAVDERAVLGNRLREPPLSAGEHPDRENCDHPDCYSQKASHQLSPSEVNGEW